jgi:DNA topoisomerase I
MTKSRAEDGVRSKPVEQQKVPSRAAIDTTEKVAAHSAGLRYVSDSAPGIRRSQTGSGFRYLHSDGKLVRDHGARQRIRSLAIPPAWTDVWICPAADGHMQAVGRDAKGRKQYRYHPRWCQVRDADKYEHMVEFARLLPELRARIARDIASPGLAREKVLATVVSLLDKSLIRVGNGGYARENDSYGLTTLRSHHVQLGGHELKFHFKGKSGKTWRLSVSDHRIARVVRSIQELPGQDLFQYVDDAGATRTINSSDVNDYLRAVTDKDVTAKDFRTWAGSVMAAMALDALGPATGPTQAKSNVRRAVEAVAQRLGNTPAVCRKSYVHPRVVDAYMQGADPFLRFARETKPSARRRLPEEEIAVLRLLERRSVGKCGRRRRHRHGLNGRTAARAGRT